MFYLINHKEVGPNEKDSHGTYYPESGTMEIHLHPGMTNSSHEERTEGWLGTNNDTSAFAYGEFETIEDARKEAANLGFTELKEVEDENDLLDPSTGEQEILEMYLTEKDSLDQIDASDYYNGSDPDITTTTNLDELEETEQEEARSNGGYIHYLREYLEHLQEELKHKEDEE